MTQAFNLSQFANNLNASGQTSNSGLQNSSVTINTTSPIAGGSAVALGGAVTLTHATSGVSAASYTNANITVNASGHITAASNGSVSGGTVTSVATGNGLSGGTITTSGTLSVACPGFNTVGSYATGVIKLYSCYSLSSGSNYAPGTGYNQIQSGGVGTNGTNNLSGTWKWMGMTYSCSCYIQFAVGVACRVA